MANVDNGWYIDNGSVIDTQNPNEPIPIERDTLELERIDENGTVEQMIKTINANEIIITI